MAIEMLQPLTQLLTLTVTAKPGTGWVSKTYCGVCTAYQNLWVFFQRKFDTSGSIMMLIYNSDHSDSNHFWAESGTSSL